MTKLKAVVIAVIAAALIAAGVLVGVFCFGKPTETPETHTCVWGEWQRTDTDKHSRTCVVCGKTESAAHGFGSWEKDDAEDHIHTCTDCGATESAAHSYDDGEITTSAGCETNGEKTFTCSVCGGTKTQVVPLNGHEWGVWGKTDADRHSRTCGSCGDVQIEAHSYDDGEIKTAAGCETSGEKTFTCSVCGGTKTQVVPPNGHEWGEWQRTDADRHSRTCGKCGKTESAAHGFGAWQKDDAEDHIHTCTDCGATESAAHSYDDGEITTAAGCETNGEMTFTCSVCGGTKTQVVSPSGHAWGAWGKTDADNHSRTCESCGAIQNGSHSFDEGTITTPAGCVTDGVKTFTCSTCGGIKTQYIIHTGHSYGAWTPLDENKHRRTCDACGATEDGAHSYYDGNCSACGLIKSTDGLSFVMTADGNYSVSGRGSSTAENLVIPSYYNGKPVVSIADKAFQNDRSIKTVRIPGTVKTVGVDSFSGAWNITSVILDEGVERLERSAFYSCNRAVISLPKSIKYLGRDILYGNQGGIDYNGTLAEWNAIEKYSSWYNGVATYDFTVRGKDFTLAKRDL